jgi:hypothetical protein
VILLSGHANGVNDLTDASAERLIVVIPLEDGLSNPLGPPHFVGPDFATGLPRCSPARTIMPSAACRSCAVAPGEFCLRRCPRMVVICSVCRHKRSSCSIPAPYTSMVRSDGGWLPAAPWDLGRACYDNPDPVEPWGQQCRTFPGTSLVQHFGSSPRG